MGGKAFQIKATVGSTEVDLLAERSFNVDTIDRILHKCAIYVTTAGSLSDAKLYLGEEIVMHWEYPDGTAPTGDQALRVVNINVPANKKLSLKVTNASSLTTYATLDFTY